MQGGVISMTEETNLRNGPIMAARQGLWGREESEGTEGYGQEET